MKLCSHSPRIAAGCSIVIAAFFAAGAAQAGSSVLGSPDSAFPDAVACGARVPLTGLDARIVAKAAEGTSALRGYITVTRDVYGLNLDETVLWLDRMRARDASCQMAAVTPASTPSQR